MAKKYVIENPVLMAEWHWEKNNELNIYPQELSYGSAKKAWWKCEICSFEWQANPNHRSRGRGCPLCSEKQRRITHTKTIVEKRGSLLQSNPKLASEWHPTKNGNLTPQNISAGANKKVWWQCKKGHEWQAVISSRNSGVGCPICSEKRLLVGCNDLKTLNPKLASEWHPTKNGKLTPQNITCYNTKKVWWQCEKGHEWKTSVSHRSNGTGCPYCSNKKVLKGFNDLATLNSKLACEWHPTKNGNLTPENTGLYCNKKIWWQCERGHEWANTVNNRAKGSNCPVCFGEHKTSFPEQAIYYYFKQITTAVNRYNIKARTEIDVFLSEYKIGIEYDGIRFHNDNKTKERENRKEKILNELGIELVRVKETLKKENEMLENVIYYGPKFSNECLTVILKELLKVIGLKIGKSLSIDIDVERDYTKIYEQYVLSEKNNSLLFKNPKLASEWHPTKNGTLQPKHVVANSNKRAWWLCKNGHEWSAVINSRNSGVGCPYCSNKKVLKGYNDLATLNPKLAEEWNFVKNGSLNPQNVGVFSNKKVWWKCLNGHEWQAKINDRTKGRNCPYCTNRKVLIGYNDLATLNPKLASEWHPTKNGKLTPQNVTCGSDKKVWWRCEKGHVWQALIYDRNKGKGCPFCAGKRILVGFDDLTAINPVLSSEWHPTKNGNLTPKNVKATSAKSVWWKCSVCGCEWKSKVCTRNNGGGNCKNCKK